LKRNQLNWLRRKKLTSLAPNSKRSMTSEPHFHLVEGEPYYLSNYYDKKVNSPKVL
jgi:hypothetical protein